MDNTHTKNSSNYLMRLFRGEISLPVTYWIYGVLIGNVGFTLLNALLEYNYMAIVTSPLAEWPIYAFFLLSLCYGVFVLIAVWRSAGNYTGNSAWATLARVAVLFGALAIVASIVQVMDQSPNSDYSLQEELRLINKGLPTLIDDDTRLDNVSLQGNDIYYNYTLVKWDKESLDIERFNNVMNPMVKTNACQQADTRVLLDGNRQMVYIYRDKNNEAVSKIVVDVSDCL